MNQEIFIIEENNDLYEKIKRIFSNDNGYFIKKISDKLLETELKNIPDLIIVNEDGLEKNVIEVCNSIRSYNDNSITPIIVVSSNTNEKHVIDIIESSVEYFINASTSDEYIYYTVKNIINLIRNNRKVSPLTGLPGNVQIQVEIKKRLLKKEGFAVLYLDLDNFKEYNDIYGFIKGDEIIKYTDKTILRVIHNNN